MDLDWSKTGTLTAWIGLFSAFVARIYMRGKKDEEINRRIMAIEKTTQSFDATVVRIHARLNAMDEKRERAHNDRSERLDGLHTEIGEMKATLSGVSSSTAVMQKTLDLLLENHINGE